MKKSKIFLTAISALAAGMVLTATAGSAWAYFTTNTSASGSYTLSLGNETRIVETYSEHTKHLVVTNEGTAPAAFTAWPTPERAGRPGQTATTTTTRPCPV